MNNKVNGTVDDLTLQASVYRILSHFLLKEVSKELLLELSDGKLGDALKSMDCDLMEGLEEFPLEKQEELLAIEYCRLFIGPGPHLSPHESVLKGEKQHWGASTISVVKAYEESGFDLKPEVREMPDHIGVELEFLATLVDNEIHFSNNGNSEKTQQAQQSRCRFMEDHLGSWISDFAEEVDRQSEIPFYRKCVRLAETWIHEEMDNLNLEISRIAR